jgi:hypothetical protein
MFPFNFDRESIFRIVESILDYLLAPDRILIVIIVGISAVCVSLGVFFTIKDYYKKN